MRPYVLGYLSVVVFYGGGMLMATEYGFWTLPAASVAAVAVGMSVGRLGVAGITLTILLMSVILPIAVLTAIGLNADVESPLRAVISDFYWQKVVVSLASALLTYFLCKRVRSIYPETNR